MTYQQSGKSVLEKKTPAKMIRTQRLLILTVFSRRMDLQLASVMMDISEDTSVLDATRLKVN